MYFVYLSSTLPLHSLFIFYVLSSFSTTLKIAEVRQGQIVNLAYSVTVMQGCIILRAGTQVKCDNKTQAHYLSASVGMVITLLNFSNSPT